MEGKNKVLKTMLFYMVLLSTALLGCSVIISQQQKVHSSINFDSFRYLAGAESILKSGSYRSIAGQSNNHFPPGTSLLYAAFSILASKKPESLVIYVNLLSYLITVITWYFLLKKINLRKSLLLVAIPAAIVNGFFLSMHNKLWSEPPCFAFFAVSLYIHISALASSRNQKILFVISSIVLGMAITIRYSMIAAIPIFLVSPVYTLRKKTDIFFIWILMTLSMLLPIIVSCELVNSSLFIYSARKMDFHTFDFINNIIAINELANQVFPTRWIGSINIGIVITTFLIIPFFIALFPYDSFLEKTIRAKPQDTALKGIKLLRKTILIFTLWSLSYLSLIIITQILFDPGSILNLRLTSPLLPIMIFAGAASCDILLTLFAKFKLSKVGLITLCLCTFILLPISLSSLRAVKFALYNLRNFRQLYYSNMPCKNRGDVIDELNDYIEANRDILSFKGIILSNSQGPAWYALRKNVLMLTKKNFSDVIQKKYHSRLEILIIYIIPRKVCKFVVKSWLLSPNQKEILNAYNAKLIYKGDTLNIIQIS